MEDRVLGEQEAKEFLDDAREVQEQQELYPCDEILWQGMFEEVAERLGQRNWEVWTGTLAALAATAHKNVHWYYHRDLYGMVYLLLVSPTGSGKGLVTDVAYDLLPVGYHTRDAVQSGPALAPILAKINRDKQGHFISAESRPVLLLIDEWTTMVKSSKIEFSNLQDILNALFHRTRAWNLSRSDRAGSGGDVVIPHPTLSICATTTQGMLLSVIGEREIRSGFLNRYLVLPGTNKPWRFYEPLTAGMSTHLLNGMLQSFTGYAWGAGVNVWDAYAADAKTRMIEASEEFERVMNDNSLTAEACKRLHVYAHIIALLYAWSERTEVVRLRHVNAALYAVSISRRFLTALLTAPEPTLPHFKQWEIDFEQRVIAKVTERPTSTKRELFQLLYKHGSARDLESCLDRLTNMGVLKLSQIGKRKTYAKC